MKLTKAEKVALVLTLLFAVLTAGYRLGRRHSPAEFSVRVAAEEPAETGALALKESAAAPDMTEHPAGKVNINTADAEELCTLSGIGETLAQRIIDYREEHGPFARIEEITNVSGIGSGTFEKLRELICTE